MPKKITQVKIRLDLLKPQSQPQRIIIKLFSWLLSSGRLLVIAVEILVLAAFLTRFKLDSDLAQTREAIEEQVPFIESLASDEALIRQTQFELSTIKNIGSGSPDFTKILQEIARETPTGVSLKNINIDKTSGKIHLKIAGTASDNTQLSSFTAGLRQSVSFQDINLADVSFEGGFLNFALTASVRTNQERKL